MASTYSTNLALELIGTGDQAGTWGNTTNTNLGTLIEQAISGYVTQAVSTGTDTTITIPNGSTGVARNMYIELTGTGGTNTNLIVPSNKKLYFIFNNSTGAVTVKVTGQTGVSVPAGKKMVLVSNGTDIVNAANYVADFGSNSATITQLTSTSATITNLTTTSLTLSNNPVLSGGTANGVLYLNGSKVATSGTDLVFNATGLGIGTSSPASLTKLTVFQDNTFAVQLMNSSQNYTLRVDAGASNALILGNRTSFTDLLTISTSGNLGIGTTSPGCILHISKGATSGAQLNITRNTQTGTVGVDNGGSIITGSAAGDFAIRSSNANILFADSSGAETMRIASGNLGLGVTPSAWAAAYKALQITPRAALSSNTSGDTLLTANAFNGSGGWTYIATAAAAAYAQSAGSHVWYNAASGTINTAISFTTAMTLDSSGNLDLLGAYRFTGNASDPSDSTATFYNKAFVGPTISGLNVTFRTSTGGATTERARITSDGNLLVGTTTATNNLRLQQKISTVHAGSNTYAGMAATGYSGTTVDARPVFDFNRSRGTTDGSMTKVESGDTLGSIIFRGADGTSFQDSAMISAQVDGATGASDMPGRLVFYTSADGAASPSERARITSGGFFKASNTGAYNSSTGANHEFNSDADNNTVIIRGTNASLTTGAILFVGAVRNTTNNTFYALGYFNETAAAYKFRVADSGDVTNTNGTYAAISDIKLKEDVVDAASQWDDIKNLRVRKYRLKSEPDKVQIGLVAQEAETVSPGLVDEHIDRDEEGNDLGTTTKSVKYSILYMKSVKALQEAMARIEQLEAKVAALETK